ncbi:hypothetical protein PIB30_062764 [Stylosanthes scabra]|uniref:Protein FAR1-RELATED SEQUENCE n=1 Tax=Stylosanthes scabra TaxID=79078 RepID=A0ABU6VLH1_9FABA|nr:hypothetical protein [Stylosanthes scabra]
MVGEFGVAEKNWIINMYEKRHMWATACIRDKFFAGFRTTSRCEDWCRQLSYIASRRQERFYLVRDTVMSLIEDFKIEDEQEKQTGAKADDSDGIFSKNPQNSRSKSHPSEKLK